MTNAERDLNAAYDGPIPPAELAAARWGAGAWERLRRGADLALIEARLRASVAALARLRLLGFASRMAAIASLRLQRAIAHDRRVAAAMVAGG